MKRKKLSFGDINDELSRDELKNIMAGSGATADCQCECCTGGGILGPYDCTNVGGVGTDHVQCSGSSQFPDSECTYWCDQLYSCSGTMFGYC